MIRTLTQSSPLVLFLLAAVAVASLSFGITRFVVDSSDGALPAIDLKGDVAAAQPGALNAQKLFQLRKPTTVMIDATIAGSPVTGAGVIVDPNGTIVTASHVIYDYKRGVLADKLTVSLASGDEVIARVMARDRYNDLAILKIDPDSVKGGLKAAPLASSDSLLVGAEVAAIGYPLGQRWTQTIGNVSATHREVESRINATWRIPDAIQFDAPINPGNSGGPLFNARGEVVGIVQQIASNNEQNTGISFAISSQIVERAIRLSNEGATDIPYAYTGISARTLSPQLASQIGTKAKGGAIVQHANGPAQRAGISSGTIVSYQGSNVSAGDVIIEIAGQKVETAADFTRLSGLLEPNKTVEIKIVRGKKTQTLRLQPVRAA